MNNLKDLTVDTPIKLSRVSSENKLTIKELSGDTALTLAGVDQGGITELEYPPYDGEYEATPTASEQTFPTKETSMLQDFKVNATPYSETATTGTTGYTVTIL